MLVLAPAVIVGIVIGGVLGLPLVEFITKVVAWLISLPFWLVGEISGISTERVYACFMYPFQPIFGLVAFVLIPFRILSWVVAEVLRYITFPLRMFLGWLGDRVGTILFCVTVFPALVVVGLVEVLIFFYGVDKYKGFASFSQAVFVQNELVCLIRKAVSSVANGVSSGLALRAFLQQVISMRSGMVVFGTIRHPRSRWPRIQDLRVGWFRFRAVGMFAVLGCVVFQAPGVRAEGVLGFCLSEW